MKKPGFTAVAALSAAFALVLVACEGEKEPKDLLARILEDGVIRVVMDPAQPPESILNNETGEFESFNIDVTEEIARRLGVTVEWETAPDKVITAGSWNDRWDMSVGSIAVTKEGAQAFYFTPFHFLPAAVAVHVDNTTITDTATDLDGKTIGVRERSASELLLRKTLYVPLPSGATFDPQSVFIIDDAQIVTYDTDSAAIQDLALGDGVRLDAVIGPQAAVATALNGDTPIKMLDATFAEPLVVTIDRNAPLAPARLVERVSEILQDVEEDGTLGQLRGRWSSQLAGEIEVEQPPG